jgi:hypothetical protein
MDYGCSCYHLEPSVKVFFVHDERMVYPVASSDFVAIYLDHKVDQMPVYFDFVDYDERLDAPIFGSQ